MKSLILILALLASAAGVGAISYNIFYNKSPFAIFNQSQKFPAQRIQVSPTPQARQGQPWFASLTALEQSFFNTPTPDASDQEKENYSALLRQNGRKSPDIRITADCQPSPIPYSVGSSTTVKFVNMDSQNHTIILGEDEKYNIPAGETITVNITSDKKGKLLGYGCDTHSLVGFLLIAP